MNSIQQCNFSFKQKKSVLKTKSETPWAETPASAHLLWNDTLLTTGVKKKKKKASVELKCVMQAACSNKNHETVVLVLHIMLS